jgi:hypothetical protein
MAKNENRKIKVINNMPAGALGIELVDGKTHVLRKPSAFKLVSVDDIWHIFNSCKTIQKGHAYIDDRQMRVDLGLEEDDAIDVNAISKDDLRVIVDESDIAELKDILEADLSHGTKERIIVLARDIYKEKGMDARKMKLLETEIGMPVAEDDGSDVDEVNDVKEQKKIKRNIKKTDK